MGNKILHMLFLKLSLMFFLCIRLLWDVGEGNQIVEGKFSYDWQKGKILDITTSSVLLDPDLDILVKKKIEIWVFKLDIW